MEAEDPIDWEKRAIQNLISVCPIYGWEVDGPKYKAQLKLIQREATARRKAAITQTSSR